MSYDYTLAGLGGVQRPPSTPYLTTQSVPETTDITPNAPAIDGTTYAEENISFQIIAVPGIEDVDGGLRAEQLISPGNFLFGVRAESDAKVSVFELAHMNLLLVERWEAWLRLLDKKIEDLVDQLQRTNNMDEQWLQDNDYSKFSKRTLRDLIKAANYFPEEYLGGYPTVLPNQLNLFLQTASPIHLTPSHKARFRTPGGKGNLSKALAHMVVDAQTRGDQDTHIDKLKVMAMNKADQDIYRSLIMVIMKGYSEITNFLTADGIVAKFNYLGIMVSSQEDTDVETIQSRGGLRNLKIGTRGPLKVNNYWGDILPKGTYLYFILRRTFDGSRWGAFQYVPYWSSFERSNSSYATSSSIGPIKAKALRTRMIPSKELCYRDISGKDAIGHVIYIGLTRYPQQEKTTIHVKAVALGLQYDPSDSKNALFSSVRNANEQKLNLPQMEIYAGV